MPQITDLNLEELKTYKPHLTKREDFDIFWENAIKDSRNCPLKPEMIPYKYPVEEVKVYDVYYNGADGARINGWYILPKNAHKNNKVPVLIQFHGYAYHKGYIYEQLKWAIQGYAVLSITVRGQGGLSTDTVKYSQGGMMGWMTLGIMDKNQYYYKNVYLDCIRAIDFVYQREEIDNSRIGVFGLSQGGGLTLAAAALDDRPRFAMPLFPYLCHFRRAVEMYGNGPYKELYDYFRIFDPEMKKEEQIFETLSYFDGMNLATKVKCPVLMGVGLRDDICPPSTIFAAYNHLDCEKQMKIYPYFGHEHMPFYTEEMIAFTRKFME